MSPDSEKLGRAVPGARQASGEARLAHSLASSAAIEAAGFGAAQFIRLGSNLILTRMLFPTAFGLMAMLSLILYGLVMLSDVGLQQAVLRSEHGDDPRFLDTAWTIQAIRGLTLWLSACLLAWPISHFFREPALLTMLPVGAGVALINGLASTRIWTLRRQLRAFPIVALELTTQVAGVLTMVGLAATGAGVWSLVAGMMVTTVGHTAFSYALPGVHREHFRIHSDCRREIMVFGRWIFASSAMFFVAGRGDQFIVGRMLGAANLAFYNIALTLADLPEALVGRLNGAVLFPFYAKVFNERPREFAVQYYRSRLIFDGLVHTSLGGLVALAPGIIRLLYDPRYQGAAPMLQLLALRTSVALWATPCEVALVAMGLTSMGFEETSSSPSSPCWPCRSETCWVGQWGWSGDPRWGARQAWWRSGRPPTSEASSGSDVNFWSCRCWEAATHWADCSCGFSHDSDESLDVRNAPWFARTVSGPQGRLASGRLCNSRARTCVATRLQEAHSPQARRGS